MKKILFDLITSPFSLFENPIYDYIAMTLIGIIAFTIAFRIVGDLGLRGQAGSIAHWIIRIIVFALIWLFCCIIIKAVYYIMNNWIVFLICSIMFLILYITINYANNHPNSSLNRKVF